MSSEVFILDKYEKRILEYLAIHGKLNLSEIANYTLKFAHSLDRWGVRKRLYGSPRSMGLIPNDYVSVTKKNKKENEYRLTVKGVLASLATVPLHKNQFFKIYANGVSKQWNVPNSTMFVKDCTESFIKLILAWHYLNGINLTKQKSSTFYYIEFLEHLRNVGGIDITILNPATYQEFLSLVKKCISYYSVITLLTDGKLHMFDSTFSIVNWSKTISMEYEFVTPEYLFAQYLWEWPLLLGFSPDRKQIKSEVTFDENYTKDIETNARKFLQKINYKRKWTSKIK